MARVKRGVTSHAKHKKTLDAAKGFYGRVKLQITARVDSDVLAWLKSGGTGYQARMNAILRREMIAAIKPGSHKRTG